MSLTLFLHLISHPSSPHRRPLNALNNEKEIKGKYPYPNAEKIQGASIKSPTNVYIQKIQVPTGENHIYLLVPVAFYSHH